MNTISNIFTKQEYIYFNKENKVETKELNVFQRIARRYFGQYKETHLSSVVDKAYKLTLDNEYNFSEEENRDKNQQLLKLIHKAGMEYKFGSSPIHEGLTSKINDNQELNVSVQYKTQEVQSGEKINYVISSVDFELAFSEANESPVVHKVSISKNNNDKLKVDLPKGIKDNKPHENKEMIQERFKSQMWLVNTLLNKILKDSSELPKPKGVHKFRCDVVKYKTSNMYTLEGASAKKLNKTHDKCMRGFGWKGPLNDEPLNPNKVFSLKANNNNENIDMGINQKLSIAFAASLLSKY